MHLVLTDITKRWAGAKAPVLRGIDLTVERGEALWIGGRNGAGKTTLLRVAAGLIKPDVGAIAFGELDVERDREDFQRRTAFLPTGSSNLYNRLTVRQHLDFWARISMLDRPSRAQAKDRLLEVLELGELADRRVDRMSMGQRQRTRLASVFLHDPQLAMLDEPANSLDDEGVALLAAEVDRVRERGGSVIWCSPKGDTVRYPFTRRMLLEDGRLEVAT